MEQIGKGSKFLERLSVNGLGELSLKDANVNVRVDFYAKEKKDSEVTGFCTVEKGEAGKYFPSEDEDNVCFVVCDTSNLDLGKIYATLTLEYRDADTNAHLVEIVTLQTDKVVGEAIRRPIAVDFEVVEVVDDGQNLSESDYEAYPVYAIVQGDTNLWEYDGSHWTSDGPDVGPGMVAVDVFTNHVYKSGANDIWEDLGVIPYVKD